MANVLNNCCSAKPKSITICKSATTRQPIPDHFQQTTIRILHSDVCIVRYGLSFVYWDWMYTKLFVFALPSREEKRWSDCMSNKQRWLLIIANSWWNLEYCGLLWSKIQQDGCSYRRYSDRYWRLDATLSAACTGVWPGVPATLFFETSPADDAA